MIEAMVFEVDKIFGQEAVGAAVGSGIDSRNLRGLLETLGGTLARSVGFTILDRATHKSQKSKSPQLLQQPEFQR